MISICVGIKNRTKVITKEGIQLNLFKNSIYSIVKASNNINFPIEIVIVDYNLNDVILEDWIYHVIKDTNCDYFTNGTHSRRFYNNRNTENRIIYGNRY